MLVVYKEPGKDPIMKEKMESVESSQELVGGVVDCATFGPDDEFDLWFNEEGCGLEP